MMRDQVAISSALRVPGEERVAAQAGAAGGGLGVAADDDRHGAVHRVRGARCSARTGGARRDATPWSCVHSVRITSMYSSSRRPRPLNGTPSASNSSFSQPTPTPRCTRPPDSTSSVATSLAVISGLRCVAIRMPVPSCSVVECAAAQVSQISGSGRSNSSSPPVHLPAGVVRVAPTGSPTGRRRARRSRRS